ncbi:hypothetical protein NDU88_006043 [Pleurodeles waltl]|uniref:Secreted protein n=1 Tax=Pleurodeles waltl TaxID=8319 RepID=A0AAV7TDP2_PLEWA|nr:hypothetical protein NDU88_006043 [Pleurodeles waltl]
MSRVCAWILLLIFRLRVVLRGCASKFRSHGRRRVDFSLEVGRRCPCEAVRRNFGLTAGVASISPLKSGGVVLARPCVKVSHSRSHTQCHRSGGASNIRSPPEEAHSEDSSSARLDMDDQPGPSGTAGQSVTQAQSHTTT